MRIKKVKPSDIKFPGASSLARPDDGDYTHYGCYNKDTMVGVFTLRTTPTGVFLSNLYAHPNKRDKGVGKYMMKRIIKKYKGTISFTVSTENILAIMFYAKLGCKVLSINTVKKNIYFYS